MTKGKEKGNAFEREVAKMFDEWWGVKPHTFWRTPLSGGWLEPGDISVQHNQNQGDIWFPFVVECKSYKLFDFLQVLTRLKTTQIYQWWDQVTREQAEAIKKGRDINCAKRLLLIKLNRCGTFVCFSEKDLVMVPELKEKTISFYINGEQLYLCIFNEFEKVYSKKLIESNYREIK